MKYYQIQGGSPLEGEYSVKGAKNSALPIMAATVCCPGVHQICGCPKIQDVFVMEKILNHLGAKTEWTGTGICINTREINDNQVPNELMNEMRSSVFLMGSLLARCGEAKIWRPGGCRIGARPIDIHLEGMKQLGYDIIEEETSFFVKGHCRGGKIRLDYPSVGATENLMMAALKGTADTVIENCAREPEILDLQGFLRTCGFHVFGGGTSTIYVRGTGELGNGNELECRDTEYYIMEDRIEAATYIMAVAGTGGNGLFRGIDASVIEKVLLPLRQMNVQIKTYENMMEVRSPKQLISPVMIITAPYPEYPTDCQPQMMALCTRAKGKTMIRETVFEHRFSQKDDLMKMGADIEICGKNAIIKGAAALHGANVQALDLRGGAALVLAGLFAEGTTTVDHIEHIERGYENLHIGLQKLGAKIERKTKNQEEEKSISNIFYMDSDNSRNIPPNQVFPLRD